MGKIQTLCNLVKGKEVVIKPVVNLWWIWFCCVLTMHFNVSKISHITHSLVVNRSEFCMAFKQLWFYFWSRQANSFFPKFFSLPQQWAKNQLLGVITVLRFKIKEYVNIQLICIFFLHFNMLLTCKFLQLDLCVQISLQLSMPFHWQHQWQTAIFVQLWLSEGLTKNIRKHLQNVI